MVTTSKYWGEEVKDDSVGSGFEEDGELLLASNCSDDGAIDDSEESLRDVLGVLGSAMLCSADGAIDDSEENGPNEVGDSLRDVVGELDSTMLSVGALDGVLSIGLRVKGEASLGQPVLISTALDGSKVVTNPLGEFVGTTV